MDVTVTGGAGFVGSHLVDRLVTEGHEVTIVDDFSSGQPDNVSGHARFIQADVCDQKWMTQIKKADLVFHLASPASPMDYLENPLQTLMTGSVGTLNALKFALNRDAKLLFTSTSEVYGDPLVHPQPETYWGNVHTTGPRACYDEAKRFSETLVNTFERYSTVSTTTVRLFNTYGPRMRPQDGRVISTFVRQCLEEKPMTVFGDGTQTRSISYIDDTVEGIMRAMASDHPGPINLGSQFELSVLEIATLVAEALSVYPDVVYEPLPEDDPQQRRPDTTLAKQLLNWEPIVTPREGIKKTAEWMAALHTIDGVIS